MRRAWLLIALVIAAACGTSKPPPAATLQSVALQRSDVPKGMVICGLSGDIDTFLKGAPANNQYASQLQSDWNALKAQGAQKGNVRVFTLSQADCKNAFLSGTTGSSPSIVLSMLVQFKTGAAAANAYTQADVQQSLIASLPGAPLGAGTGLGKNSLVFHDEGTPSIYFAYWQNARFLALLLTLGIGPNPSRQAAIHVNSRIH